MYGRYPIPDRWRVDLTYVLALAGLVPLMIPSVPGKLWNAIYMIFIFPVLAFILSVGGFFGLPYVPTELWGGLLVTLVVASLRHRRRLSHRHSAGARPALENADRAHGFRSASSSSCAACRSSPCCSWRR